MAELSHINNNDDDNNSINKPIQAVKTGPGRYKIPRREVAKREIRRLVIQEGLTGPQISQRLNLPTRTVTRYLQECYRDDNNLLAAPSAEELATLLNMFRDRIDRQRLQVLEIANNPEVEATDRLAAHDFLLSLDWIVTKLNFVAPVYLARFLKLQNNNGLVKEQKGLNITLNVDKLAELNKMLPPTKQEREGMM